MDFSKVAEKVQIDKAIEALKKHGINAEFAESGVQAKERVLSIVPKGAKVMNMTSVTIDTIGVSEVIEKSGEYRALKTKLYSLDKSTHAQEMQEIGAAPEWTVGSVHAVTEDGKVVVASATGSQLPAYAYGSQHVVWVVGGQKIVPDLQTAFKRIEEYALPLESERARKAYGVPGSAINKMLIINNEVNPQRLTMIIVNEALGF